MNSNIESGGDKLERELYQEQCIDMRKIFLRFTSKIGWVIGAAILGIVLGAGIYELWYLATNGVAYQSQSKVYLYFAPDDTGDVYHQYYNGYTWNDLMVTDPILDKTMQALEQSKVNVSREQVAASTEAKILSDVRLLTLYFTNEDETLCRQIQEATEQALSVYGQEKDVFLSIETIQSDMPKRMVADYRIKQAILLGFVLATIVAVLGLLGYLILDDRIFVPYDLLGTIDVPFVGIMATEETSDYPFARDYQTNLEWVSKNTTQKMELCVEEIMEEKAALVDYEAIREADFVLVKVVFGKTTLRSLQYVLYQLKLQDCPSVGVALTEVSMKWMKRYYRWGQKS